MIRRTFALLCLSILALCSAFAQSFTEHHSETYAVDNRWTLLLRNEAGGINVVGWNQPKVQVDWDIVSTSKQGLDVAWVEIRTDHQQVNIQTAYPIARSKTARERIMSSGPGAVNFTLHVPRALASIELATGDGHVNISGVQANVRLSSMTGTVLIENSSGNLDVSTLHSRQTLRLAQVAGPRSIKLQSVNGSIQVSLSRRSDVKVAAASASGSLSNDFGWAPQGRTYESGRDLRGTLGKGDANLEISEVNGSVTITADR